MTIKILVVDDSAVVRKELTHVLGLTGAVRVVGEASDGWDAIEQTKALAPDIVLMDLEMPGLDGVGATRHIKTQHLAQTVVVFSVYATDENRNKAVEAGADAFIVKGIELRRLIDLFEQLSEAQNGWPNSSTNLWKGE